LTDDAAPQHRSGFITLVGRPNVGKSTLLNQVIGTTLAAVANKPQTTRNRIVGILNRPNAQLVFVDTPGIHHAKTPLNARLVTTARQALGDGDVAVLVVDASAGIAAGDREVAAEAGKRPHVIVAVTKSDLAGKQGLLPVCAAAQALLPNADVVPVSGKTGDNVERLVEIVTGHLPEGPPLYPPDQVTEQSERFLAAEIVREKLFRLTGDELPYTSTVVIDKYEEEGNLRRIAATIVVERDPHKAMIIGSGGERLKRIGTEARHELEHLLDAKVFLELWVKVRGGWADDEAHLRSYGYE
jgi:GTP-binding protein Era